MFLFVNGCIHYFALHHQLKLPWVYRKHQLQRRYQVMN
jgi:hypothetical protein